MSISLVTSQIKRLEIEISSLRNRMQKKTKNEPSGLWTKSPGPLKKTHHLK